MEKYYELNMIRVRRGHWEYKENHKLFGISLGKELKYETMEDWYKITSKSIIQNKGGGLLKKYYNNSPIIFCKTIFPEYEWLDWKFNFISRGYWDLVENRKKYAIWLGKELNFNNMEDWYNITMQKICNNDGNSLMVLKYNSSPIQFLRDVFSQYEWLEWKLTNTTNGYWKIIENHTKFANWLGKELNFNNMEDWYNITYDIIYKNGGSVLLTSYYNHSPLEFLQKIYTHHEWLGWKLTSSPNNFWDHEENIKKYAIWLGEILGYKKMEDWYNLDTNIIAKNHGRGLITYYKLIDFIRKAFPDYEWLEWKFGMSSNGYWKNKENHKKYANWLFDILQYNDIEDWYKINKYFIEKNYGSGLLSNYYNHSPALFVCSVYPEHNWDLSKFTKYYSNGQIEWLEYVSISRPDIIHILNNNEGEFRIPKSRYKADGYSEKYKEIYEYHGDFWHGNPEKYNKNDINPKTLTTFGELYNKTTNKKIFIENNGYKYYSIYESQWINAKKCVIVLQNKFRKNKIN
jgi:hypothetical protein